MKVDFNLGKGAIMCTRGKKEHDKAYYDLTAGGIFCCMFGAFWYKVQLIMDRARPIHLYSNRFKNHYWKERYEEALRNLTGMEPLAIYTSGTEAVEAFLRVAWAHTGKSGMWGGLVDPDDVGKDKPICDQFHGWTLGSRILAGRMTWNELGVYPELGATRFGMSPQYTACMAMEPYHAPSGQFHREDPTINRIRSLRKEYPDILFLIDEIQGGFGRCGKLFAHEWYDNLKPDFVTIGKLAGAGFPLAVLLGPKEILESDAVQQHAYLHSTHSASPLICCAGTFVIEEMLAKDLITRSYRMGLKMHGWLAKLPVRVHGKGLMAGLEFESAEEAAKVVMRCEQRHVLVVDTGRKWVKIGPCLNIDGEHLEKCLKILGEVVIETVEERTSNTPARGTVSTKPESSSSDVESVRFQGGVERIVESSQDGGQEGPDNGAGSGEVAPSSGS